MIVKKFQAPTENEAILKAKDELGTNAVILNVKTLRQRGVFRIFKKDSIEITAALEEKEFIKNVNKNKPELKDSILEDKEGIETSNKQEKDEKTIGSSNIDLRADEEIDLNDPKKIEERLDALQRIMLEGTANKSREQKPKPRKSPSYDLNSEDLFIDNGKIYSKEELESKTKTIKEKKNEIKNSAKEEKQVETSANDKFLKLIYKKLEDNEVDKKYIDEIIEEIRHSLRKESNIDDILSAIYQKIILKLGKPRTIEIKNKPKLVFFIGPTGVGKTTTIAKIASKFKLEKYAKVAFITSDTYRIAAVEQLNTYASIIDCPVDVVYGADELSESLESFKSYDLILVDTAGRSHKSEEQMEELMELLSATNQFKDVYDLEIYLTLSVTTKYKDLVNITNKYKCIKDWGIIFTKLDETCSLGNIINIKMLTNAPLSYTTSGQNVPNDIEVVNEQFIAKQLLGGNQ